MQMLEDKRRACKGNRDDPKSTASKSVLSNVRSNIQLKLHRLQDSCLSNKIIEVKGFADRNNMKNFLLARNKSMYSSTQNHHLSPVLMNQH